MAKIDNIQNLFKKSEEHLLKAHDLDKNNPQVLKLLIKLNKTKLKNKKKALQFAKRLLSIQPDQQNRKEVKELENTIYQSTEETPLWTALVQMKNNKT